ncbi:MAG TPA: ribosomal protein S18-alanine N-acetyltransferase [Syntrophorhabdaceae bacterium]|nr:ribosomal protein S18-alanine N-acetyltransferase [Syntrophorhabdaceae bacterium]
MEHLVRLESADETSVRGRGTRRSPRIGENLALSQGEAMVDHMQDNSCEDVRGLSHSPYEAMKRPVEHNDAQTIIREMHLRDVGLTLEIEKKSFIAPWSSAMFGETLVSDISKGFVLELGKRIVGYIIFYAVSVEAHIMNLAVDPLKRRQGYAARLLSHTVELLKKSHISECYLEVREHNKEAIGLYSKFGFEVIGRRKRYYPETGEDAFVMRLTLTGQED